MRSGQRDRGIEPEPGRTGEQSHRAGDADELADHEPGDDAESDRVAERGGQAGQSADRDTGGEEREDRNGDDAGDHLPSVREVGGQAVIDPPTVFVGADHHPGAVGDPDRHREGEQHPGHGGMDAGGMNQRPRQDRERQQHEPGPGASLHGEGEQAERHEGGQQRPEREVVGKDDRDDGDGHQVVDDRQGEQERPQRRRQRPAHDGENRHGEGDIGGGRDGPALPCPIAGVAVDRQEHECGCRHSGERRRDG